MAMIPEEERPAVHRLLGRHLLHRMTLEDQIDSYIFEICNQLNKATMGLSQEESEQLIELNLRAGRKALRTTAFDGAMGYFQTAQSLLGDESWERQRRLTLDVYLANVERWYSSADYAQGNMFS
jgi:predicted ATPase